MNPKSYKEPGYGTYNLLTTLSIEHSISIEATEWAKCLDDGIGSQPDPEDNLNLVILSNEIYFLLDLVEQKLVNLLSNENDRNDVWKVMSKSRQNNQLIIVLDYVNNKINDYNQSDPVNLLPQIKELSYLAEELESLDKLYTFFQTALNNNEYKVYYDYLATLKLADGKPVIENSAFMKAEMNRLNIAVSYIKMTDWKPLDEFPEAKKILLSSKIIPPGITRSLPRGIPASFMIKVVSRTLAVAKKLMPQNTLKAEND